MKRLQLSLLCVFVCSQHTEGVTDQQVTLGQSVTLACEFKCKAAIWFVIKPSVRPVMILRTFGSEEPEYYDEKFRNKYSEGDRSQLIIKNIAVDDLGTYYCIKPGWTQEISDGMRLDTEAPQGPDEPEQKNLPQDQKANQILIVMLTLTIIGLIAAMIGLLIDRKRSRRKTPRYINFQQILDRRTTSIQTNDTVPPQNPLTDHEYLEVLPYPAYENDLC